MKHAVAFLILPVALALGQQWDFTQVDTADWGAGACAWGSPDTSYGIIYYNSQTGVIRSATWDGDWTLADLPIPPVHVGEYGRAFSAARFQPGREVVACQLAGGYALGCAVSLNDSWILDTVDATGWYPSVEFDSAGVPALLYSVWLGPLVYAARYGSSWDAETLAEGGGQLNYNYIAGNLEFDREGRPHATVLSSYQFPRALLYGCDLVLFDRDSGVWRNSQHVAGGPGYGVGPFSLAIDSSDIAHHAYFEDPPYGAPSSLHCDGSSLDSTCSSLAMVIDHTNRVHVAWVSDSFRYGYYDGAWHLYAVGPAEGAVVHDILLSGWIYPQPAIVYTLPGGGLWLATGDGVAGTEEIPKPQALSHKLAATVVRSLPAGAVAFDAMGRRVMNPRSGIFFVRDAEAQAVRKVIIER